MTLDVFYDDAVLGHDTGAGVFEAAASELIAAPDHHPEGPQRIRNMHSILERGPLAERITFKPGREATREELELVHTPAYIDSVAAFVDGGGGRITGTTVAAADTDVVARTAAGTAVAALESVLDGAGSPLAYALVRPPGHHAQPAQVDGYCFYTAVAIAAEVARRRGIERVAIVDWDVHHGNGTQECFASRSDVLTVSLHMAHGSWGPTHLQTGRPDEIGDGDGAGFNVNLDLDFGTGDAGYLAAVDEIVTPVLEQFDPGLVLIAAGQDPSQFDPNGRQCVTMAGFRGLGARARGWADRFAGGRLVLVQEGGYAPTYAAFCLHATLEGVLGLDATLPDPLAYLPDDAERARPAIDRARAALGSHWRL